MSMVLASETRLSWTVTLSQLTLVEDGVTDYEYEVTFPDGFGDPKDIIAYSYSTFKDALAFYKRVVETMRLEVPFTLVSLPDNKGEILPF